MTVIKNGNFYLIQSNEMSIICVTSDKIYRLYLPNKKEEEYQYRFLGVEYLSQSPEKVLISFTT